MIVIVVDSLWLLRLLFALTAVAGASLLRVRKHSYAGPWVVIGGAAGVLWIDIAASASWAFTALPCIAIALALWRMLMMRFGWRRD